MASAETKRDPNAFPVRQLLVLGICRFSEPIAFNSILAYNYEMVKDLHGGDDTDASFYAGLLVSAYAVAEAMTAMGWGLLSDRYGRKPVVLIGLAGVALSCLIFGLARSYWVALLARFIGGALNGNVAVMQTMVAEMVKNPDHEPKAYAVQPFVWTLGGIIGSAMGGFLAQPAVFYPSLFSPDGLFGEYPYLLPNLVSVVAILLAILQGIIFLEETNTRAIRFGQEKSLADGIQTPSSAVHDDEDQDDGVGQQHDERTPLTIDTGRSSNESACRFPHKQQQQQQQGFRRPSGESRRGRGRSDSYGTRRRASRSREVHRPAFMEESLPHVIDQNVDLRRNSFGTVHSIRLPSELRGSEQQLQHDCFHEEEEEEEEYKGRIYNRGVIMMTAALVVFSYHQMAFGTIFPVYLLDTPQGQHNSQHGGGAQFDFHGGLGYTVHDVGTFLSVNGVIGLAVQAFVFPPFVDYFGVWTSFVSMVVLFPTNYAILPFLSGLSPTWLSPGVYLAMILQSFFSIIVNPCALILLKNATPSPQVLGRVNGMAMALCCLARTFAPPVLGIVYSAGGSAAAWLALFAFALSGTAQLALVPRALVKVDHVVVDAPVHVSVSRPSFSHGGGDEAGAAGVGSQHQQQQKQTLEERSHWSHYRGESAP